jgi:predicted polyphosphate/ATP-dependent NAD kinase
MSKDLMISLLRKGNTGVQILEILDSIATDLLSDNTQPTTVSDSIDLQREMLNNPATVVVNFNGDPVTI